MGKPKVITLCGSSRFCDIMAVVAWILERDEKAITMGLHLLPQWYVNGAPDHIAEHEGVAEEMDELHLRKIDMSDEIFVINHEDYIGESTSREIAYTSEKGKPVRYFLSEPEILKKFLACVREEPKPEGHDPTGVCEECGGSGVEPMTHAAHTIQPCPKGCQPTPGDAGKEGD